MTEQEERSYRRKISLLFLVKEGSKSIASALDRTEDLYDEGKLVKSDYDFLAEFFENQLMKKMETNRDNDDTVEPTVDKMSPVEEITEEEEE